MASEAERRARARCMELTVAACQALEVAETGGQLEQDIIFATFFPEIERLMGQAAPPAAAIEEAALVKFTEYFTKNYPGPHTVITDPKWHAPKIFRAAVAALRERNLLR